MTELEAAASGLAVGDEGLVGQFIYRVGDDGWWWSDEMFRIHGFEPRQVPSTTEVLQAHNHPEDLEHTREVLGRAVETGEPFSCYHRIIDARGRVRHVVAVADAAVSSHGQVQELRGYLIDLTKPRQNDVGQEAAEAVRGATEHRATIEQAKGIIMFVYGVDSDAAFAILKSRSHVHNIKVRDLAAMLTSSCKATTSGFFADQRLTELLEPGGQGGDLSAAPPDRNDAWTWAAND